MTETIYLQYFFLFVCYVIIRSTQRDRENEEGGKSGLRLAQSSRTPLFLFQAIAHYTLCKIHTRDNENKTDRHRGFYFFSPPPPSRRITSEKKEKEKQIIRISRTKIRAMRAVIFHLIPMYSFFFFFFFYPKYPHQKSFSNRTHQA